MKAIIIDRFGTADELHIADMEKPVPGKDQVGVRVQAVGINPVDFKVREGGLSFLSGKNFPNKIPMPMQAITQTVKYFSKNPNFVSSTTSFS